MRLAIFIALFTLKITASYQQSVLDQLYDKVEQERIFNKTKKELKKFFHRLHSDTFFDSAHYKIIPSFIISDRAVNYDGLTSLVGYLEANRSCPVEYAVIFQRENYIGVVDLVTKRFASMVYDSLQNNDNGITTEINHSSLDRFYKAWKILKKRNYEFVFSVRYMKNFWWFIEGDNLYIINLEKSEVHNADEFIRGHCSKEVIRNLAIGNLSVFCN